MELVNEFTVNAGIDKTWATLTDVERIAPCMPGAQLTEIEGDTYRGTVGVKVGPITAKFKGEANFVEQDEAAHKAVLKAAGRDTGGKGNASALITAQLTAVSETSTHVTVTTDLTITGKVAQFGRGALADVSTKLIDQFVQQLETTVLNDPDAAAVDAPPVEEAATAAPAKPKKAAAAKTGTKAAAAKVSAAAPEEPAPEVAADDTDSSDVVASPSSAQDAPGSESVDDDAGIDTAAIVELAEHVPADASPAAAPAPPTIRKIDGPEAQPIDLIDTAGGAMMKRLLPLGLVAVLLFFLIRRRGGND
jgi:carbon monoxide dehydrogenase subunit G